MNAIEKAIEDAEKELAWLKKTAENDKDYARIVGYEDCLRLFAHLQEGGWRDIESAPRDGTQIIGCNPAWDCIETSIIRWERNGSVEDWYCVADGCTAIESQGDWGTDYKQFYPTHWMPLDSLPQLPKDK